MDDSATRLSRRERILERLRELGAEPKRSLGQNFLISDFVVEKILAAARAYPFSQIVEVGPGLGALTEDLLSMGEAITLLELDRKFVDYWKSRAQSSAHPIQVMEGDALQMDWTSLALSLGTLFVSNLPYQISSSLVIERCLEPAGITRMILMFQKEVAQRLNAKPRTPEYGLLTVMAQTFWNLSTVVDAGPQSFYPPPNVSSRVVMFRLRTEVEITHDSRLSFLRFVKAAFSHRRKLMAKNLLGSFYSSVAHHDEAALQLEAVFKAQGLLSTARAEELDPKAFVRLYLAAKELGK